MHRHPLNHHPLPHPPLPIHLPPLQPIQRLHPTNHPPKHRIPPIQMRRGRIAYKELAPIGLRPFIRHADDTTRVVPQGRADLVFEIGAPDGGAGFGGGGGGGAGLDHEGGDRAVEGGGGVEVGGAEGEEVLGAGRG